MFRAAMFGPLLVGLMVLAGGSPLAEEPIGTIELKVDSEESDVGSEQEMVLEDRGTGEILMQPSVEAGCYDGCATGGNCHGECRSPSCSLKNACRGKGGRNNGFFAKAWLDQGFTGNTDSPKDHFNGPLKFNDRANQYQMNQFYLSLGRAVDRRGTGWDIGGRLDLLYGSDYFFTMARGLETHRDGTPRWNSPNGPRGAGASLYGLAMPQLYAEVAAPVGEGLTVKLGHFYTILGYESVMAPENFFYSRSYAMQYGEPLTHTGMLATYDVSPCVTVHGGVTRGWDTWEDPNDSLGFLGGVTWTSPDQRSSAAFAFHTGNEDAEGANNRTVYSVVFTRHLTPRLTYIFQHDLGVESNAAVFGGRRARGNWYDINQYLIYRLSETTSLGLRAEWFRDEHSTRIFNIPSGLVEGSNYTEITLGLNWQPHENMVLRPEIRWDWSDVDAPTYDVGGMYDEFSRKNQLTLAVDLLLRL